MVFCKNQIEFATVFLPKSGESDCHLSVFRHVLASLPKSTTFALRSVATLNCETTVVWNNGTNEIFHPFMSIRRVCVGHQATTG